MKLSDLGRAAGAITLVILGTCAAQAGVSSAFTGSRAEVRAICTSPGMTLTEEVWTTACWDTLREVSIMCASDTECVVVGLSISSVAAFRRAAPPASAATN